MTDSARWLDIQGVMSTLGVSHRETVRTIEMRHVNGFPPYHLITLPGATTPVARWDREEVQQWIAEPPEAPWAIGDAWPAPEVLCRLAEPQEIPQGAWSLMNAALPDWKVTATYARGTWPVRDKPGPIVDSLALRFKGGIVRGYGLWVDSRFKGGGVMYGTKFPVSVTATQIRAILREKPRLTIEG